jgi:hypothetical protein
MPDSFSSSEGPSASPPPGGAIPSGKRRRRRRGRGKGRQFSPPQPSSEPSQQGLDQPPAEGFVPALPYAHPPPEREDLPKWSARQARENDPGGQEGSPVPSLGFLYARLHVAERIAVVRTLAGHGIRISEDTADEVIAAINMAIADAGSPGWSHRPLPEGPAAEETDGRSERKEPDGSVREEEVARVPSAGRDKPVTANFTAAKAVLEKVKSGGKPRRAQKQKPHASGKPATAGEV